MQLQVKDILLILRRSDISLTYLTIYIVRPTPLRKYKFPVKLKVNNNDFILHINVRKSSHVIPRISVYILKSH